MRTLKQIGNWLGSWRTFRAMMLILVAGVSADQLGYSAATRSADLRARVLRDSRLSPLEASIMAEVETQFANNLQAMKHGHHTPQAEGK